MNPIDQDTSPEDEASIRADIAAAHFAPPAKFQGIELWPYTPGTRSALLQAFSAEDLFTFRDMAFAFVHVKRGGPTVYADVMAIMPALQNSALLHVAMQEWEDKLSGGDFEKADAIHAEAKALREAAYALAKKTEITASDPEGSQKPSGAVPQTTTASFAASSLPSSGSAFLTPGGSLPSGSAIPSITPTAIEPAACAPAGTSLLPPSIGT